jgi:hypothetical protein
VLVIDRRHPTHRPFAGDQFQFDLTEKAFRCPRANGCGIDVPRSGTKVIFLNLGNRCAAAVPAQAVYPPGRVRKIVVNLHEPVRQAARELVDIPGCARSRRERNKNDTLLSELKLRIRFGRAPLRWLWNTAEQFYHTATATKLKREVKLPAGRSPSPALAAHKQKERSKKFGELRDRKPKQGVSPTE